MQAVNAHVMTLNHVSKFRDHAVHQFQPPKPVRSPLRFLEACDFFLASSMKICLLFIFCSPVVRRV